MEYIYVPKYVFWNSIRREPIILESLMWIYCTTKWEPEPTKKRVSEFQQKYKAEIGSLMEEHFAPSRIWVGTAPATQCRVTQC